MDTLTKADIEKEYRTEGGLIRSPGKFEGEPLFAPYFWDQALNGMADEDDGESFSFEVTSEDVEQFPELATVIRVSLSEDSNGFIHTYTLQRDTLPALIDEHSKEIVKQALKINSLPGLVDWFTNEYLQDRPWHVLSSDVNAHLRGFFTFTYHINLNERGYFSADVRDCNDDSVYDIKAGNELEEGETSIFDDGFMKHKTDLQGLAEYLRDLGVIPRGADIVNS